jgi:hypothetical protein
LDASISSSARLILAGCAGGNDVANGEIELRVQVGECVAFAEISKPEGTPTE